MKETIFAADFKKMVLSASAAIGNNRQMLNEMNVFPVPDGDTGINMSLTIKSAATAVRDLEAESVSLVADKTAAALLRGARGNSGVILSLLFRGFAKSCAGLESMDAKAFATALNAGVEAAYRAVMKPAEGTILTVSRKAAEKAVELSEENQDILAIFPDVLEAANVALKETQDINPVLKKAGVVDAGGMGWVLVLDAMYKSLQGQDVVAEDDDGSMSEAKISGANFAQEDEEITFAYCTEYIINLSAQGKKMDPARLRAKLETIGDCVVVVDDEEIIKVHVHTNNPDIALCEALKYGELVNIKIENMREQHSQKVVEEQASSTEMTVAEPEKKYGFVAVVAGSGLCSVYEDLGVDKIVQGGQTMNPSTDDILAAVNATPSEVVFVLPNNKNIIMAAQQVIDIAEKKVVVIPTKTVPQGVSAMLVFDPDASDEDNAQAMETAANGVSTGSITYAARDSDFDGHTIREGEYLALNESKLSISGTDLSAIAEKLVSDMGIEEKSFVTVFYGEGVTEEDAKVVEDVCKKQAPDAEIMVVEGGQPVYYYIISAE